MSQRLRSARVISAGHAFVPTCAAELELSVDLNPNHQLPAAFTELAQAIQTAHRPQLTVPIPPLMQQRRALAGLDRSLVVLVEICGRRDRTFSGWVKAVTLWPALVERCEGWWD
jgi:hypothetical protein